MEAEAYLALTARYETPLFSYAARMLGGLGDGERCLVAALATGWQDLQGSGEPTQPGEWLYTLVREQCFDELAQRPPAATGDDDLENREDCVAVAADSALAAVRPAYRDLLLLRDVHGLDIPELCAVTDMGPADVENQLYRARAEFARTFAGQPARPRCRADRHRRECAACAQRERLRETPQHALLQLGPLPVRDRLRDDVRAAVRGAGG